MEIGPLSVQQWFLTTVVTLATTAAFVAFLLGIMNKVTNNRRPHILASNNGYAKHLGLARGASHHGP